MLLRIRVSSFLAGFGLASAAALWQLRNDITTSSEYLAAQVRLCVCGVRGSLAVAKPAAAVCLQALVPTLILQPNAPLPTKAQEAQDTLNRRVAALEALVLPKQQPAAAPAAAEADLVIVEAAVAE